MPILKAQPSDIPELEKLINSAYRGESAKKGWTSESHLLSGIRINQQTLYEYLNNAKVTLLKYTDEDGKIIGSVYLELRNPKLYIGMFSVNPGLQGAGIGKALLAAAEQAARNLHCTTLTMTVITVRHELIDWYKRKGFAETGEIIPFPTDTKFGIPNQPIELCVLEKNIKA